MRYRKAWKFDHSSPKISFMVFPDQCHCFLLGHHGTAGLEIKTVFQVIISDQREVKGSGPS